jgi:GT2 family glycosyltransferase
MFLSVIVPTCNRNILLRKCLDNLVSDFQTIDSSKYEIIVSDDSKVNDEIEILKEEYPFIHFIDGPKKGPAANRNFGSKHAKGEWLIFIDDDCMPDKELLINYYKEIIKGNYKGIEGYINADRPQERFDEQSPLNLTGGCFWSCNIAVDKEIFNNLGGFDESFIFWMEDIEFSQRLKSVTKTTFLESAKVVHPWRRVKPFKSYKSWIKGRIIFSKKTNTNKDLPYRIKMINLFIGSLVKSTITLINFSFRGLGFYLELNWFNFLMIFK